MHRARRTRCRQYRDEMAYVTHEKKWLIERLAITNRIAWRYSACFPIAAVVGILRHSAETLLARIRLATSIKPAAVSLWHRQHHSMTACRLASMTKRRPDRAGADRRQMLRRESRHFENNVATHGHRRNIQRGSVGHLVRGRPGAGRYIARPIAFDDDSHRQRKRQCHRAIYENAA